MNLADAIRNAAGGSANFVALETVENSRWSEQMDALETDSAAPPVEVVVPAKAAKKPAKPAAPPQENPMSDTPNPQPNHGGNVVRLELFLTAEQIALLFKSIVTGQHTVMTLREAAAHLRLPAHSLEQMAQDGDVPSFQLDGRWRFSRTALDEWLALQTDRKEQEAA